MATHSHGSTHEAIISAAAIAVRENGYNALSFRDLAAEVGVKSSSVHHHFRTKGDLADALIDRFREDFVTLTEPLMALPFEEAFASYLALHRAGFERSSRLCLGAMMSAEVTALQKSSRERLAQLIKAHTDFIAVILSKKHPRVASGKLEARAFAIFTALEGAQVLTHGLGGDPIVFDRLVETYATSGLFGFTARTATGF